jgi:D-3-phosphoglycerate dehydrogenase
MRVLVTPRAMTRTRHPAIALLEQEGYEVVTPWPGRQPTEAELLELLPGCIGYIAGVEPVTAAVIGAARNLVALSRNGTGTDSIDMQAARSAGIRILTAPGANSNGVAELTVALILALARAVPASDRSLKAGDWKRTIGFEIDGATLGVVGCGNVGRAVATRALALGMKVLGSDPYPGEFSAQGFHWVSMDELLAESRVVSLHCPASANPLIDERALSAMPEGSCLVNTARASLVDSEAVLAALESGALGGYAVDAYDTEPPSDRRLVEHDRVIATPHIGGYTVESVNRAAYAATENLLAALRESGNG